MKVVREKRLEILGLERSLCEVQNIIRSLVLRPAMILQKVLKDCGEITDQEIGLFLGDNYGRREALERATHEINLTKGKSLTPGKVWESMPLKEAYRLIFDPIVPLTCVGLLKAELAKMEGAEEVSVHFYLKTQDFMIRPCGPIKSRRDPIETEEKNGKKE